MVPLHPDNPGNSNGMRFPESYKSSDAFEIVSSATMRTRLGQYLALEIAGANTSNPAWNSFALSIQQFSLNWASIKGGRISQYSNYLERRIKNSLSNHP